MEMPQWLGLWAKCLCQGLESLWVVPGPVLPHVTCMCSHGGCPGVHARNAYQPQETLGPRSVLA